MKKVRKVLCGIMAVLLCMGTFKTFSIDTDAAGSYGLEAPNYYLGTYYGDSEEHLEQLERILKADGFECFSRHSSYNLDYTDILAQHINEIQWDLNNDDPTFFVYMRVEAVEKYISLIDKDGVEEHILSMLNYDLVYVNYFEFRSGELPDDRKGTIYINAIPDDEVRQDFPDMVINFQSNMNGEALRLNASNDYRGEITIPMGGFIDINSIRLTFSDDVKPENIERFEITYDPNALESYEAKYVGFPFEDESEEFYTNILTINISYLQTTDAQIAAEEEEAADEAEKADVGEEDATKKESKVVVWIVGLAIGAIIAFVLILTKVKKDNASDDEGIG